MSGMPGLRSTRHRRRLLLAGALAAIVVLAWVGLGRPDRAGDEPSVPLHSRDGAEADGSLELPERTSPSTRSPALQAEAPAVVHLPGEPPPGATDPALELPLGLNPYTFRLPTKFGSWLADPVLNAEGYNNCMEGVEDEYGALVQVLQSEIARLQFAHEEARGSVVRGKLLRSDDVAERESPLPPDAIAVVSVAGIENGVRVAPRSVFVRHGDSPELDALDRDLRASILQACAAIRSWAGANCSR